MHKGSLKSSSILLRLMEKYMPWLFPSRRYAWFLRPRLIAEPRFKIQLADKRSHFEQAFQLFDADLGQVREKAFSYPTHCLLPTTATIVALWDERVVATLLLSRPFGMGFITGAVVDQRAVWSAIWSRCYRSNRICSGT